MKDEDGLRVSDEDIKKIVDGVGRTMQSEQFQAVGKIVLVLAEGLEKVSEIAESECSPVTDGDRAFLRGFLAAVGGMKRYGQMFSRIGEDLANGGN